MGDYLAKGKFTRKLVDTFSLPLPAPETLNRASSPYEAKPLTGKTALVQVDVSLASKLTAAGLSLAEADKVDALVFDACNYKTVDDLKGAYSFFHENLGKLNRNGRVIVISTIGEGAEGKAIQRALDGFTRSISKETGRKGITANLLVWQGTDSANKSRQLLLPTIYLLSNYSAYVNAQTIRVGDDIQASNGEGYNGLLAGKAALVTGAARGIGAAIAKSLARECAKVFIVDVPQVAELATQIAQQTGGAFLPLDITAADAPQQINDWLQKEAGGVDFLVHNAGITRDKTLAKMDEKYWDLVLAVNFQAILNINKVVVPGTLRDGGTIIGMSSISGFAGNFGQTNYAATKAALIGYAAAFAPELKSRGISVNAIAPGFIETKMVETMPFFTREGGRRLNNLSQAGLPEDIAEMATFLCMAGSRGITGQALRVCGGSLIGA